MEYATVDGERSKPFVGGKGCCPMCGAEMIAKCGPRVLHHWAHKGRRNCDPWWENETDWHREWKGYFPENCREIHHKAEDGGDTSCRRNEPERHLRRISTFQHARD